MTASGGEAGGKPGVAGVHTNQRLSLSKPWEGPRKIGQGFKPDSGNLTVRHYRGASGNVRHGETVNPPAIERAGTETPHLQRDAPEFYPNNSAAMLNRRMRSVDRRAPRKPSARRREALRRHCARSIPSAPRGSSSDARRSCARRAAEAAGRSYPFRVDRGRDQRLAPERREAGTGSL